MVKAVCRVYGWTGLVAALVLGAAVPARAQYRPRLMNDVATGEQFHIEASAAWWRPGAGMSVKSEGFGIEGTLIDFKRDLGLEDQSLPQLSLALKPAKRHKFRFQFIPIKYEQNSILRRRIVFNGQGYPLAVPVTSSLNWKAYRFNYEYDIVSNNRGFAGFIMEVKHTDVRVDLTAVTGNTSIVEFAQARLPLPALGGIGRVYVVPNISITGELTAFKLPDSIDSRYGGHYVDADIYGTINFNNYLGGQIGWRSLDLGYLVKSDTGSFTLRGLYFGVVARY